MAQQGIDIRFATPEGLERFQRRPRAAHRQDFILEALPGLDRQDIVAGSAGFFEGAVGVGRQYLCPLVAIVAGRVAAGKDVAERVLEAIVDIGSSI